MSRTQSRSLFRFATADGTRPKRATGTPCRRNGASRADRTAADGRLFDKTDFPTHPQSSRSRLDQDLADHVGVGRVVRLGVEREDQHWLIRLVQHGVWHAGWKREAVGFSIRDVVVDEFLADLEPHERRAENQGHFGSVAMVVVAAKAAGRGDHEVGVALRRELVGTKRFDNQPPVVGVERNLFDACSS